MSQPKYFYWEQASTTYVAPLQTLAGAGDLTLTAAISSNAFNGNRRTVSLTSANNLSGRNFTIYGTLQGGFVDSETIAGPNANTVETTKIFVTVTRISVDGAAAAVSAGSGTKGAMPWVLYDYNRTFPMMTIQSVVTGTITYSFVVTMSDVNALSQQGLTIPVFDPIVAFTGATTSLAGIYSGTASYVDIYIDSSTDGTLSVAMIQQGIT